MPKGDTIKKVGIIAVVLVVLGLIGYRMYQIHYANVAWCTSHARLCEIYRLKNGIEELEKANTIEVRQEVAK